MNKDLKIGMIIGVVLLIAATLVISFLSQGSLRTRLKEKFKKDTSAPTAKENTDKDDQTPVKPPTLPTAPKERIHTVRHGETINQIANRYYGNPMMIIKIVDANPQIPDNYKLKPGMKLKIPK